MAINLEDKIRVSVLNIGQAERLRTLLVQRGVDTELVFNSSTCTTGCSTSAELWADKNKIPEIQKFFSEEYARNKVDADFDPALFQEVFDPDKATATCPACGTTFETSLGACSDCGLSFG